MKAYVAEIGHVGYGIPMVCADKKSLVDKVLSEGRILHNPWPAMKIDGKESIRKFLEGFTESVRFYISVPAFDGKGEPVTFNGTQCAYSTDVLIRLCEVVP